ncbi:MAG TPA: hypothetical protein VFU36_01765 [Jatrophihabitans sp.]|nr:hypothetical protein [Jatrophihabitans sp.]
MKSAHRASDQAAGGMPPGPAWLRRAVAFGRGIWHSSYRPALIATGVGVLLAWGFLLLPPMNSDLAAQLARADFASNYPISIIDFRWFGGTVEYGYTLWATALMAHLGTKVTGALAAVIGTWYTTRLLHRLRPSRPVLGGIAAAVTQVANVVEGRITFACGLTCGLVAITLFTTSRIPRWLAISLAVLFSLLCGGASPVAALLLWVAGAVALLLHRPLAAAVLIIPSGITSAIISVIFGDGGHQPFTFFDCLFSFSALLIVLISTPQRCRAIRLGALIGMLGVVVAFVLPTPVGSNATRLSLLFALPVVVAFIQWRNRLLAVLAVLGVGVLQLPVAISTLASTGRASGYSGYYTPVIQEIRSRGPLTGRVEVPEMAGHWDSVYLARGVPLARGWLRQTDVRLNDAVFYKRRPTPQTYRTFLLDNAVQYVAVPDAELTRYGRDEWALINTGLPYLSPIWRNAHWTVYEVHDASPLVDPPGRVISQQPDAVVLSLPADQTIRVRLRWYRWLGMESQDKQACIAQDGLYVTVHTGSGGNYTFNSKFPIGTGHCPRS